MSQDLKQLNSRRTWLTNLRHILCIKLEAPTTDTHSKIITSVGLYMMQLRQELLNNSLWVGLGNLKRLYKLSSIDWDMLLLHPQWTYEQQRRRHKTSMCPLRCCSWVFQSCCSALITTSLIDLRMRLFKRTTARNLLQRSAGMSNTHNGPLDSQ